MTDAATMYYTPAVDPETHTFVDPDLMVAIAAALAKFPELRAVVTQGSGVTVADDAPEIGLDTTYLQEVADAAAARGSRTFVIPPRDPSDHDVPWVLDGSIELSASVHVDASRAKIAQTVINKPAFYVPPGVNDVSIDVGLCYLQYPNGVRPTYAEFGTGTMLGAPEFASNTGIMSYGSRGYFRGRFRGFRSGVRLGNWSGAGTATDGMREANVVDILVEEVDFGLIFSGQKAMRAFVRGSYLATVGTNDRPHLVYGTGDSDDCTVNGMAWNSTGGAAFIFKQAKNLTSTLLQADNCPAILDISDRRGPVELGLVVGTNLSMTVDGALAEPVRGATAAGNTAQPVSIERLKLVLPAGIPAAQLRACSLDAEWSIDRIDITYSTDEIVTSQTLIHIYGERSSIGAVRIRNLLTGGVRGMRYTTGGQHMLTAPPQMDGVSLGVLFEAAVTGAVHSVVAAAIRTVGGGAALVVTAGATNVVPAGGSPTLATIPAGSVISTTSSSTRPTSRTDVTVLWLVAGAAPAAMLPGDVQIVTG